MSLRRGSASTSGSFKACFTARLFARVLTFFFRFWPTAYGSESDKLSRVRASFFFSGGVRRFLGARIPTIIGGMPALAASQVPPNDRVPLPRPGKVYG